MNLYRSLLKDDKCIEIQDLHIMYVYIFSILEGSYLFGFDLAGHFKKIIYKTVHKGNNLFWF